MLAQKQVLPQQLRKNREAVPHTHLVHCTLYPKPHIIMPAPELRLPRALLFLSLCQEGMYISDSFVSRFTAPEDRLQGVKLLVVQ